MCLATRHTRTCGRFFTPRHGRGRFVSLIDDVIALPSHPSRAPCTHLRPRTQINGVILVHDLTRRQTAEKLKGWRALACFWAGFDGQFATQTRTQTRSNPAPLSLRTPQDQRDFGRCGVHRPGLVPGDAGASQGSGPQSLRDARAGAAEILSHLIEHEAPRCNAFRARVLKVADLCAA